VLTGPAAVAWSTGGLAPPVDRTAAVDLIWAAITTAGAWLVTTNVEAERSRAEYDPAAHGYAELAVVPWYRPAEFAAATAPPPQPRRLSDHHPAAPRHNGHSHRSQQALPSHYSPVQLGRSHSRRPRRSHRTDFSPSGVSQIILKRS